MKSTLITLFLLSFTLIGFSQNFGYDVRVTYKKPVKKEMLAEAKTMRDINPGYPDSWIAASDYISAEILTTSNGKTVKSVGQNNILSREQRDLLRQVDLGSDIAVEVKYKAKNVVTEKIEINTMKFTVTLVPEIEAEYPGGYDEMKKYLKEHAIDKISEADAKKIDQAVVSFTIDEEGKSANVELSKSSEDEKIDKVLLETIRNMPRWKPAKNANCLQVKQRFEFTVGNKVGC